MKKRTQQPATRTNRAIRSRKTPLTPQQAINNFKLFLELSERNSYADYRAAVREIAATCLDLGIVGDDQHPGVNSLEPLLAVAQLIHERCPVGAVAAAEPFTVTLHGSHLAMLRDAITKATGNV